MSYLVFGNVGLTETTWILALHQLLLFILIIGRWLLPTGEAISRDQLSQLLLVFTGIAADILEFVTETVKELTVRCDFLLILVIMGFWSWSLLQFALVLSATKARKTRMAGIQDEEEEEEEEASASNAPTSKLKADFGIEEDKPKKGRNFWSNMEVWGIMSTLILQDGPFLAVRLYVMIGKQAVHQMIIFFTCKNLLIVILQLYRLIIIATSKKSDDDDDDDLDAFVLPKNVETVKALALAKSKFAKGLIKNKENTTGNKMMETKSNKVAPATNGKELPEV